MSNKVNYQDMKASFNNLLIKAGPSALKGESAGAAAVRLLQKASIVLNDAALSYRINQELEKIEGEILSRLEHSTGYGCLIVVGTQEWEHPDPAGGKAKAFLSLYLARIGVYPHETLRDHLSTPGISMGAPKGWVRKEGYIWATLK